MCISITWDNNVFISTTWYILEKQIDNVSAASTYFSCTVQKLSIMLLDAANWCRLLVILF